MPYSIEDIQPPSFQLTRGRLTATQKKRINTYDAADLQEYLEDTAGSVNLTGNIITVRDPLTLPGFDYMVLDSIIIEPFVPDKIDGSTTGLDGNTSATTTAGGEITETYVTLNADLSDDQDDDDLPENTPTGPNVSYAISARREMMTTSLWALKWAFSDAAGKEEVPPDLLPGVPIAMIDVNIRWTDVPTPPWNNLFTLLGKVNNAVFLGFEAEEVLFTSFDANRKREPQTGQRLWDLNMILTARRVASETVATADGFDRPGWNHFLQPNPTTTSEPWCSLLNKSDSTPLVDSADLSTLLTFP